MCNIKQKKYRVSFSTLTKIQPKYNYFYQVKTYEIGPGSYDDKTITADGEYVLSNMRSSGKRTMFKGKRTNIFVKNETIPGPG